MYENYLLFKYQLGTFCARDVNGILVTEEGLVLNAVNADSARSRPTIKIHRAKVSFFILTSLGWQQTMKYFIVYLSIQNTSIVPTKI